MEIKMPFTDWFKHLDKSNIDKRKKEAVDYLMYEFLRWFEAEKPDSENDISLLKFTSLFFLVVSEDESLLDDLFTEFWAEPYGAVEKDVKFYAKHCGRINNHSLTVEDRTTICVDKRLVMALGKLKAANKNLITYPSFDLLEVIRLRYSWARTYHRAREKGLYTEKIPTELIKQDYKNYYK